MAKPKKRRNFRTIQVNGEDYRWRFGANAENGMMRVSPAETTGQTLVVHLIGWENPIYQPWYWFIENQYVPPKNEPESITNKFVRKVILFALDHGWQPHRAAQDFQINSHKGILSLPEM